MTAFQAGFENGQLCRKYANQYTQSPTPKEWTDVFEMIYTEEFPTGKDEFIDGCQQGWSHSCGNKKIKGEI